MSNKKRNKLQEMSIKELLDYQDEQMDIYNRLKFEVDNWALTQKKIRLELMARKDELDFLELEAELDRKNQPAHLFEIYNNIH